MRTIEAFLEKENKNEEDKKKFIENIYEHLTFFISSLPDNYTNDANLLNKYFEAMNSQGRGLEQHEILKVDLLRNMHKNDDPKVDDQTTLTRIWNVASQMDRPIIKQKDEQGVIEYRKNYVAAIDAIKANDFSRCFSIIETIDDEEGNEGNIETIEAKEHKFSNTFREDGSYSPIKWEELLLLALDITNEEQKREGMSDFAFYNTDKLLERFEDLKSTDKIKEFYRNLLFCRLLMDYCVIRREIRSGEGDYTLLIKDSNESAEDGNADNSESIKLRQFQSMLYVSTPFYEWLKPFLIFLKKELEGNRGLPNVKQMLAELKRKDNEEHKEFILNEGNLSYHNINRYWFWRLDYYLWETRDDWCKCEDGQAKKKEEYKKYYAAVSKYVFRENRSIEHFHPQDESHNTSWNQEVDSFGNLAMISPSFNSQQSNDHLQIKFDRIHEQLEAKSLQSLKLLRMCLEAGFDHSQWTEDIAKKHGEDMIIILKESFLQEANNDNVNAE